MNEQEIILWPCSAGWAGQLQPAPAAGADFLCESNYCSHSTPAVADPFSRTGQLQRTMIAIDYGE